jgi:AcrR family transcriptional regulator
MAQRKAARRTKLQATAIRLFAERGYHATTVPMIVAESGSSTGSFYSYFRSKEDIFAAALEDFGARMASALNAAIAATPDPLAQMKAAVEEFVRVLAANPDDARVLIVESSGLSGRLQEVRRKIIESHARSVEGALKALAARLPPLDRAMTARCWVGAALEGVSYWLQLPPHERPGPEQAAATIAGFNLRGIGAGDPR